MRKGFKRRNSKGVDDLFDVVNREIRLGKLPMLNLAMSYTLRGARFNNAVASTVIRIPYATPESTGLSIQTDAFRPYLMAAVRHLLTSCSWADSEIEY